MTFALVNPIVGVPLLALTGVCILAAVGVGPSVRLAGTTLLSPVLGLGLVTAVLTTVALLMPLGIVGPVLLVVASIASTAWAWRQTGTTPGAPSVIAAALATFGGLLVAVAPALGHRTYGPVNLHFNDSWFYTSLDWYLQRSRLGETPVLPLREPPLAVVHYVEAYHVRVGIDAWQASFAALIGVDPILIQSAAQASTVAVISLTTYGLARCFLHTPRRLALIAAFLSLSPVTVQLFTDPRPANLGAIALAPVALAFGARAVTASGQRRDAVIAGIATAGLIVTYTEHMPTFALAGTFAWLCACAFSPNRRLLLVSTATRVPLAALTAFVLSPLGSVRAVEYAAVLSSGSSTGSGPQAGVGLDTLPVLLAGTRHLHELDELIELDIPTLLSVYAVTVLVLALAVVCPFFKRPARVRALLLTSVGVLAASVAMFTYFQLKGGCGDCVYKPITLSPVFLAVAVVATVHSLWGIHPGRIAIRLATVVLVISYGAVLARGQAVLVQGADRVQAAVDPGLYRLPTEVAKLAPGPIALEGAENTSDFEPFFHGPEMLYLLGRDDRHPLRYEKSVAVLLTGFGLPEQPYASDYRYVASGYPGLVSDRRRHRDFGEYSIDRREGPDLLVLQNGGTREPRYRGPAAIPWLRGPLALRVVGAQDGAVLVMRFTGGVVPTTAFEVTGHRTRQTPGNARGEAIVCVDIPAGAASTDITVIPGSFSISPVPREEVDGPLPVPKGIGLAAWSIQARGAPCRHVS